MVSSLANYQPPQKRQKMSITQTYFLAHTARGKLAKEAGRPDHNLRLLVGHANLLDELMLDLAHAEAQQESWFNKTVTSAREAQEEKPAKHIQWADTVVEEPEEDWEAEDASLDSDSDDEDMEDAIVATTVALTKPAAAIISTREVIEEEYSDDDSDSEELALTRTESRHPPELTSDSEEESEDESMPPSPPSTTLDFTEKQRQAIATTSFYDKSSSVPDHSDFFEDGYYLPSRQQPTMVSAF